MSLFPSIQTLRSSWTKFDAVKVIQITINNQLKSYYEREGEDIDVPVLRNYIGISSFQEPFPDFWNHIQKYPEQIGLFSLIAALFTHYENIEWFANKYSKGNMEGVLVMGQGKHFTNLRSALVESGASEKIFRRKEEVPYDLSKLFKEGEVGKLAKDLFINRLKKIGHNENEIQNFFLRLSYDYKFPEALSISNYQYEQWTNGNPISNTLYELDRNGITYEKYGKIKAIKIKQWLSEWNNIPRFNEKNRLKPPSIFYQFSIPAILLKRIYDVHSRTAFTDRKDEAYSQRKHSTQRSSEIKEFIHGGYPWSTITSSQRESDTYKNLQMPGWLPTSILANILANGSIRKQKQIQEDAIIKIIDLDEHFVEIILPKKIWSDQWAPILSPIEIIDGQHRIKAFDSIRELNGDFEFPVIAFENLDFTWQAYLFYTINIKPKRINTSLAYDLMPLLRIQDWLEQDLNGPDIYRKVRAQELTELLWSSEISPWYNRINMLGDTGESKGGPVSQNAFINSLITTFVKRWDGRFGGLFGGEIHEGEQDVIQWDKETQASFLILIWWNINKEIAQSKVEWVIDLKSRVDTFENDSYNLSKPFIHPYSFFTTDQGIRPVLYIFNDMCFEANDFLGLNRFFVDLDYESHTTSEIITLIYDEFKKNSIINGFVSLIAKEIINKFDWRTPSAFDQKIPEQDEKRQHQNQFRGSGGYREMRIQLLRILSSSTEIMTNDETSIQISDIAYIIQSKLGL